MIKGYRIRIYPNKEQKILIEKHIGACRFTWNYMLNLQNENYKAGSKYISRFDMIRSLTPLKKQKEYQWLNEVSMSSLQNICTDLDKDFKGFFKKEHKYPNFKNKKKSKKSYPVCESRFYFKDSKHIQIQKLGIVKCKTDFKIPIGKHKFSNIRLSKELNKYFISFGLECENQVRQLNNYSMGVDLGVKDLAIVSYGDNSLVFHNINKSSKVKKLYRELKHLQRSISRKYETNKQGNKYVKTNNIIKAEEKLRKINKKISDIRNNYIHQITHKLIELLPKRVVMEKLNVLGMMKNKHIAKAIGEQNFYKFIEYMKYKCEWNGIKFIQVDRFYPSSKKCSCCGNIKKDLKLSDRVYVCKCGLNIDRDLNAAINLKNYVA